jgi:hypothetical protein
MFTSANYQLIRSNCTDSNVHGNKKKRAVDSRSKCDKNLEIVILLAKNIDQKCYLI